MANDSVFGEFALLLIVCAVAGAAFVRRPMPGTTSERLMRRATQPMLVVRHGAHVPYHRALVATDFSPSSVQALAAARRFAPHAHLVMLHALQVPFQENRGTAVLMPPTHMPPVRPPATGRHRSSPPAARPAVRRLCRRLGPGGGRDTHAHPGDRPDAACAARVAHLLVMKPWPRESSRLMPRSVKHG